MRLKNYVWLHHCTLKAKVQCDFSSAYSLDHTNVLRTDKYKFKHRYNTTRHQIIMLHHYPFIGMCVLFVIFEPNFPVDSPNSNLDFFPRCYGGHSVRRSYRKAWRLGMRFNRVLVLREQQVQNAAFCKESFVFTCLTYKNVQHFLNGQLHKFYSLKDEQSSC